LAGLALAIGAAAAGAQPAAVDDSLYQALGGRPSLEKLMDDFMPRLLADKRTGPFFAKSNIAHVKEQLVIQFSQISGGPGVRQGCEMKTAHENMDIRKREFNALVEVLQQSMDARNIPFHVQNRLLARLAPMHREIVNTP